MTDSDDILRVMGRSADGVYAVDRRQRIVFWNESAERITGFAAADVLGKSCYDVISGCDYEGQSFCRRNCPTITSVRRNENVANYDIGSHTSDGQEIWLNMSIVPVRRRELGPLALHMFRDVTPRRRAERLAQETLSMVERFEHANGASSAPAPAATPRPKLTRREVEVLRLLADGVQTREIAARLTLSIATTRNHVEHILAKLGVHNRLQAVLYASQHDLLSVPQSDGRPRGRRRRAKEQLAAATAPGGASG